LVKGQDSDWAKICYEIQEKHREDLISIKKVVNISRNTLIHFLTPPLVMKAKVNKYLLMNYPGKYIVF
jgi:hypothetical protein